MKKLFIFLFILLLTFGCASRNKNNFYSRKYPSENKKSYNEKRGLMILNNNYLGKNKALYSKHNIQTKNKAYKRYKKINKYHKFKYPNR